MIIECEDKSKYVRIKYRVFNPTEFIAYQSANCSTVDVQLDIFDLNTISEYAEMFRREAGKLDAFVEKNEVQNEES